MLRTSDNRPLPCRAMPHSCTSSMGYPRTLTSLKGTFFSSSAMITACECGHKPPCTGSVDVYRTTLPFSSRPPCSLLRYLTISCLIGNATMDERVASGGTAVIEVSVPGYEATLAHNRPALCRATYCNIRRSSHATARKCSLPVCCKGVPESQDQLRKNRILQLVPEHASTVEV